MSSERGRRAVMKGKNGEREFCRKVAALTDGRVMLRRNLTQCRDSGDDTEAINDVGQFSIEIKRWKSVTDALLRNWWSQCYCNANKRKKIPVLAFRADHQSWQVMMHPNLSFPENDVRGCIRIDVELFCQWLLRPVPFAVGQDY